MFYLWNCSTCHYCKCCRLFELYFVSSWWMISSFSMCGLPDISFNFPVKLSHLSLHNCHTVLFHFFWNYKPPCFLLFHRLPLCFLDCYTILCFFLSGTFPFSLYECHTNILCNSIIFVKISQMCLPIFFKWMSLKNSCVSITSKWTLHFASFWVITDTWSFLSCVHCHTSFLK